MSQSSSNRCLNKAFDKAERRSESARTKGQLQACMRIVVVCERICSYRVAKKFIVSYLLRMTYIDKVYK